MLLFGLNLVHFAGTAFQTVLLVILPQRERLHL